MKGPQMKTPHLAAAAFIVTLLLCYGYNLFRSKHARLYALPREARWLTPRQLMDRAQTNSTRIPRLLHQSWKSTEIPKRVQAWSRSCRQLNPDWEYVLWTDEDNRMLVERFATQFVSTYEGLYSEIYRADAARLFYVLVFGGVYLDLDTECIRPYDGLLAAHGVSSASSGELAIRGLDATRQTGGTALLGRMGTDEGSEHSIPNAWLASTPGHSFWSRPLTSIKTNLEGGGTPEAVTGPINLWREVNNFNILSSAEETDIVPTTTAQNKDKLVILPFDQIYPYSWQRDGDTDKLYCLVGQRTFNATKCKERLALTARDTYSITYWQHGWDANGWIDPEKEDEPEPVVVGEALEEAM